MSRRRLERGYWNGRQVTLTDKEFSRIYLRRADRGGRWYHRFEMMIHMDFPWPDTFDLEHRLPRKTKKALWKQFNGRPETDPRGGVLAYNGWFWGTYWSTPGLLHKGGKP